MTDSREYEFRSPPDSVDAVHLILESFWIEHPVSDEDRMAFEIALVEVAGNIFEHGGAASGIRCICTLTYDDDRLSAELVDDGRPAQINLSPRDMPGDSDESGRGIPFVLALMHEFSYRRDAGQNVWKLVRMLGAEPADE